MSQGEGKTMVSSWNEWDPLKHVIVGRAEGGMLQAPEPAVYRDFAKDGFPYGKWGPMPEETRRLLPHLEACRLQKS